MRKIEGLFTSLVLAAAILFSPRHTYAQTNYPKHMRILEVRYYYPGDPVPSNATPDYLRPRIINALQDASKFHGYSNTNAQAAIAIDSVQVYNRHSVRPNPDNTWEGSYRAILAQDNLCDIIRNQDIDQVWLWFDDRYATNDAPGLEWAFSSTYLPQSSTPLCVNTPSFVVMGMGFGRPVTSDQDLGNGLHGHGHFMEDLIERLQGVDLYTHAYTGKLNDYNSVGSDFDRTRCGNVHYPPNGSLQDGLGYDYTNTSNQATSCEDWNSSGTGRQVTINCSRWGCTQTGYLKWWFQNMPNMGNTLTYNGKRIPNWWDFWVDMDEAIESSYINTNYYLNRAMLSENNPSIALKQFPNIDMTSSATQPGGLSLSWSHTVSSVNNRYLVVFASYRASIIPQARLTAVTYGNQAATFVRRDKYHDFTTEIWILKDPTIGTRQISTQFNANPEDQAFYVLSLKNINATYTPTHVGTGSTAMNPGSTAVDEITQVAPEDGFVLSVLSTYPNASQNTLTENSGTIIRTMRSTNGNIYNSVIAQNASGSTRSAWNASQGWPWAASSIAFKRARNGSTLALFNNSRQISKISVLDTLPPAQSYTTYTVSLPQTGNPKWVMGDWDGNGSKTPGAYMPSGAFLYTNDQGATSNWGGIWFGLGGVPIAGRFIQSQANDCIGVTDSRPIQNGDMSFALYYTCDFTSGPNPPKQNQWISTPLPNSNNFSGVFQFTAGDWNGDGVDSIAVRRGPYIAFTNVAPSQGHAAFNLAQYFGAPSLNDYGILVSGDWNGDGIDSFGMYYQNGFFYYRYDVDWNSGLYNLQQIASPIGANTTAASW